MSSNFESIFKTADDDDNDDNDNGNVANTSLKKLFKTRKQTNPNTDQILNAVNQLKSIEKSNDKTSDPVANLSRREKARLKVEKETRTIFIGNLPTTTKKESLMKTFKPFGKIETIRFRNIIPDDSTKSKKFAFITKQTFSQVKSINAFIRFSDVESATKALDVNGAEFEGHHLRVDMANGNKSHDNKRSVFLGGLPFLIDDEKIYGHFKKCGSIDYVRVIRDNRTGIGKGIGYVVFKTSDSVNLALKLNNSDIENRKIRVERCVKKKKVKKDGKHQSSTVEEKSKTKAKQKTITVGNKQADRKYSKKAEGVKNYDKKVIERKKMNKIKTNCRPTNKFKF